MLKKIWTDDVVEFEGQFYNIPASKIGPKPIQKPHIPIYLGGYSQSTFVRIANYANGWICVIRHSLDEAKSNINKIRNECRKAKRDPKDIHIAAILYPDVIDSGNTDKERHGKQSRRHLLSGSVDQAGTDLQEVERIGVDHFILNFNRSVIGDNTDKIIEVSKQLSSFVR
jgi:alkanesulfonate monooxygenase SsuD/methylene tetrahydromethanopterin reductase-like flavin-dependent oxidoreductase (luciferase family)